MRRIFIFLTALSLLVLAGCSNGGQGLKYHLVASGKEGDQTWRIWAARESGGQGLCMKLKAKGGNPEADSTGACGFGADPSWDAPVRTVDWDAADGVTLVFGPVSDAAVKERVSDVKSSTQVVSTQPLPADTVHGRWFLAHLPTTDTDEDPTPLDAQGRTLPQANFY